jgi:hypothetical protein
MNKLQRFFGVGAITLATIGLAGCNKPNMIKIGYLTDDEIPDAIVKIFDGWGREPIYLLGKKMELISEQFKKTEIISKVMMGKDYISLMEKNIEKDLKINKSHLLCCFYSQKIKGILKNLPERTDKIQAKGFIF